jgi:prevent-host-death family protein
MVQNNVRFKPKATAMKTMTFSDDIRPLSEFRSKASGFIAQVHKTKRPLVITQNGKSAAVLMDVVEYEKMAEKIELFQDIETSLDQIRGGKGISHSDAHRMLKSRYAK